jgi:hypothetical protein
MKIPLKWRIYLSMVGLIIVTFLITGTATYFNFKEQNEVYNKERVKRKAQAILSSVHYYFQQEREGEYFPFYTKNFDEKIKEFSDINETISYVNKNDKPLGLYYFGSDQSEENHVLNRTSSGGVTVNDVLGHIQQEDIPFGGVGPSGTGSYHGEEGFKNFSNPRAVYKQIGSRFDKLIAAIRPPYTGDIEKILKQIAK